MSADMPPLFYTTTEAEKIMNEMLNLENVCISFGESFSLSKLTFQVMEGEIFGFLGPSGAGKTTAMKLLTKQLTLDSGSIRILGKDIRDIVRADYDNIGILSDTNGLYERMTIEQNLQFFASVRQIPPTDVQDLLKRMELYDTRKTPVKKASKGMRQRTTLAAAILHRPRLLFLDEPTSGLDPATIQKVHKILQELNREGTTIFLTTHNMEEADKLCGRIGILDRGSLVAADTPMQLKLRFARDEIEVLTAEHESLLFAKDAQGGCEIKRLLDEGRLLTVHSREPNLEEIFIKLTGRKF